MFGLDIGSFTIRLVQAEKSGGGFFLKAWGETATPADINSEIEKDKITIAEAIKKLVSEVQPLGKDVVVALAENQVYTRVIQLPLLKENELASAISFEAEEYIPVPLDQVKLDHIVLSRKETSGKEGTMDVLLVGAQKKIIERIIKILTLASLNPVVMETEILAIARLFSPTLSDVSAVLDIGHAASDLAILEDRQLKFVHSFGTGGEAFTRAIATSFSISSETAEQYKRTYGLDEKQLEGKVAVTIAAPFSIVLEQIKKGIDFYLQENPGRVIKRIILTGGTALMPEITSHMAKNLNTEVVVGDPFFNFHKRREFPANLLNAPSFATATGLAIREEE